MKKLILILILFPLFSFGQILELYTGAVEAKNDKLKFSALVGGNLYLDLFQTQRQGAQQRVYANRMLIGFEHSALISKDVVVTTITPEPSEPVAGCNCTTEEMPFNSSGIETNTFKHKVRAVSLNVGVEVYKGWYLLSGLTNYQHIFTKNSEEYSDSRTFYIDAGLQKVLKYNRWFFIPKVKFNPETTTFAIGVSYK